MSNKDRIKRFYIMPEVWITVTQSQVFNWIKLINEEGISTDCISITSHKNSKETIKKFEESLKGRFIEVNDPKRLIVSDMYITLVLLKFYFANFTKYKKIIFQTRLGNIGYPYRVLGWLPKVKLIFEGRGAGNEERKHSSGNEKIGLKMKIKAFFSETNEKLLLTKSHKIICVSHALEKYYMKKFSLSKDKFTVFPGAADSELFFNDDKLRFEVRQELELDNDDVLIVYSGRLEMKWEIPDKIFNFFKDIRNKNNHFKLLLVTPDVELANEFKLKNNLEAAVYVKKVDLNEVNKYLNAADIGMLLREDIPMNNVASPTKFAEYMMAGLPVIISNGVHDFANIIDTTKFGAVVEGLDTISDAEFHNLMTSLEISRYEIAKWGVNNLSKRVFIEKYTNVLKQI